MYCAREAVMHDRELVDACVRGEEEAWREFLERFGGLMYHAVRGCAHRLGLDRAAHDADDAFATVVLALLEKDCRRLREFRWECSLRTWLSVVAARCASNFFRGASRRTRPERRTEGAILSIAGPEGPQPSQLERREQIDEVRSAVARLPERDRLALVAFHIDGRSYEEIARLLRVPASNVSQIVARARKRLRDLLSRPGS